MGMWNRAGALVACAFMFSGSSARAQTCGAPISLNDFYGIRGSGYEVFRASIQGQFLLLLGHKVGSPSDRWPVWVQDLGSNGTLEPSDRPNMYYLGEFNIHPGLIKISSQGFAAFVVADPATLGRTLPYSPTTEVPGDRVLYVCNMMNCGATANPVHRFHPRDNPYYFTQPYLNFMVDGTPTEYRWDEITGNLIYSYVQYDNWMSLNQPWTPAYAVINPPTPRTAIALHVPGTTSAVPDEPASIALHESLIPANSGDGLVMAQTIQSGSDRYVARRSNGTSLGGNSHLNTEHIVFEPDPSFPVPPANTHLAQTITDWTEDPNAPGWINWQTDQTKIGLATTPSASSPTEMVAVRTILEAGATQSVPLRDAVYRTSATNFLGSDLAITPPNDGRDVKSVFQLDRPVPTFAIETTAGQWGAARTDLYTYTPNTQAGAPGSFQLASSVPISAPDRFWLREVSKDHVIGWWDRFAPYRRDISLVHCP